MFYFQTLYFTKTLVVFRYYCQYEGKQGADRKKMEKISETDFRETIANTQIHRGWDVDSHIRAFMLIE